MRTMPKTKEELTDLVSSLQDKLQHLSSSTSSLDRLVLSHTDDCAFILSDDGIVRYVAPNVGRIFRGVSTESIEGRSIDKVLNSCLSLPLPIQLETPIVKRCHVENCDGATIEVRVVFEPIKSDLGTVLVRCCRVDGDSIRSATDAQRGRFQRLVEGLMCDYFFFSVDSNGRLTYLSPGVTNVLGYEPSKMVGMNWRDFIDVTHTANTDLEQLEKRRFSGEAHRPSYEAVVRHADGSERTIEVLDVPVVSKDGVVVENEGICRDITDARRDEERRRQELQQQLDAVTSQMAQLKSLYNGAVECMTEFVIRWRPDGTLTYVNPAFCEFVRKPSRDLVGQLAPRLADPATGAAYRQQLQSLTEQQPVLSSEICVFDEFGNESWQHWRDLAIFNASGKIVEVQSVGRDITTYRRRLASDQTTMAFKQRMETLSPRERQVMVLVTEGDANKVIARKLELSVKTVEKHRSSMMRKLDVQSVAMLVRCVIQVEQS